MNFDKYIGLPYVDRGCWELVRLVYREMLSINLPDYAAEYAKISEDAREELRDLIVNNRSAWASVSAGNERSGDAVLFRMLGQPSHIGVVTASGFFLHVRAGQLSCVEPYRSPKWLPRLDGFYRHENL